MTIRFLDEPKSRIRFLDEPASADKSSPSPKPGERDRSGGSDKLKPWEKYRRAQTANPKPWEKYATGAPAQPSTDGFGGAAPTVEPAQGIGTDPFSKYEDYLPVANGPMLTASSAAAENGRNLRLGVQAVGRGVMESPIIPLPFPPFVAPGPGAVDIVGGLQNLVAKGLNLVGMDVPQIDKPIGGSEHLAGLVQQGAEAAGIPVETPQTSGERMLYDANRMGASAATGGAGLIGRAGKTALSGAPTVRRALMEPYHTNAGRALAVDTAAGAGSGSLVAAGHEYLPQAVQGPVTDLVLSLLGGLGGAKAVSTARAPAATAKSIYSRVVRDPNVPADATGRRPSIHTADAARRRIQAEASDPQAAAQRIREQSDFYRRNDMPQPTSGPLSNDEGLLSLERSARSESPAPFVRRDREVAQEAAEQVRSLDPGGPDPRTSTQYVSRELRNEADAARGEVQSAQRRASAADLVERELADRMAANRGTADDASATVDRVYRETLDRERARKNELFQAIDPDKSVMRDITPLAEAAADVRRSVGPLAGNAGIPDDVLRDIEAIAEQGGRVSFADIQDLRPRLRDAIEMARRAGNGQLVRNLDTLRRTVEAETPRLAAEGGDAAESAAAALDNYREVYAPRFVQGEGGELRRAIDADRSGARTTPTATAGRFLKSGPGSREAASDLQRIFEIAPNAEAGRRAGRQYLMDSLAGTVGYDGKVSATRLREWIALRQGVLENFPEFREEVGGLLRDVVGSRSQTNQLAKEVDRAVATLKRTRRGIEESALSIMVDADPVVAVRRVFSSKDPAGAMAEITAKVRQDETAYRGWKRAIAKYLAETVTTGNTASTARGERPVSLTALSKLFERQADVLSKVYVPAEMHALRRAHMAVEDLARLTVARGKGATFDDMAKEMRYAEIGLKSIYGGLRGGNMFRNLKLALKTVPGLDTDAKAAEVIRRSLFDPELAAHLLDSPVPETVKPRWNKKLGLLLGLGEAGRTDQQE